MRSGRTAIGLALLVCLPGFVLRLTTLTFGTLADTALFGLTVVAAAFLLSWAAEAAEVDIAQGLAVAFIALIAVLPEYAVSVTFAWKAGTDPSFAPYAVANMTGGNRLLIGAAWPFIFFLFWFRTRGRVLTLERSYAVDVVALGAATIYSFVISAKGTISLIDTLVLAAIFVAYILIISRAPAEEPELVGPSRMIGTLPRTQRRISITALFLVAAGAILASAEPFADGLIDSGKQFGVDEFLLVQWLAPFASEAPEFLVAGILAWRGRAGVAMGALLSSKVNQWTLLIGGLPIAYAISGHTFGGLPMDVREQQELFLTGAQSLFAVAILMSLSLNRGEAFGLIGLFLVQFLIPDERVRMVIAVVYLVLAAVIFLRDRRDIPYVVSVFFRAIRDPMTLFGAESEAAHAEG